MLCCIGTLCDPWSLDAALGCEELRYSFVDLHRYKRAASRIAYLMHCDATALARRTAVIANNAFNCLDASTAVFPLASFLQHSCIPNARYTTEGGVFTLTALRDIEQGEIITIDYGVPYGGFRERNAYLWGKGFVCTCELCTRDDPPFFRCKCGAPLTLPCNE